LFLGLALARPVFLAARKTAEFGLEKESYNWVCAAVSLL
jgi:hypothetical protein